MQRNASEVKLLFTWVILILVFFTLFSSFGFIMRLKQAGYLNISGGVFYQFLTAHGLGQVSILLLGPLLASRFLARKYIQPSASILKISTVFILTGFLGVLYAILAGKLALGWYFLYPIIFYPAGYWTKNIEGLWLISMILVGIGLLLLFIDILVSSIKRYGVSHALGWHYFTGRSSPDIPPIVIILSSMSIVGIVASLYGAALLLVMLLQWIGSITWFDPLRAKNMTFMFGHCLANLAMLVAIAGVYESMPTYSGKPWKSIWMVAAAWNIAVVYVLLAMYHHLYMDYVQPLYRHYLGNIFSYVAPIPALVVTIAGAMSQFSYHKAKGQWEFPAFLMFVGLVAFIAGGAAAVMDATIPVNFKFHNTLWVPAHFHTYFGYGVQMIFFGLVWHILRGLGRGFMSKRVWTIIIALITIGWILHLGSFYLGGAYSVPRRFAEYTRLPEETAEVAVSLAKVSVIGVMVVAAGFIPLLLTTINEIVRSLKSN